MTRIQLCTAVLFLAFVSCTHPRPSVESLATKQGPVVAPPQAIALLPNSAWATAKHPPLPPYPPIARLAGIQGEVISVVVIDKTGSTVAVQAISGPIQLRPITESYLHRFKFDPNLGENEGPWALKVTMRYDKKGFMGIGLAGTEITLQKVPTPDPQIPPGFPR